MVKRIILYLVILTSLLVSLLLGFERPLTAQETDEARLVRIAYSTSEALGKLAAWFDVWEVDTASRTALIYVTAAQEAELRAAGYTLEPGADGRASLQTVPGYPCYHTVTEMYVQLQQWAAAYPQLAQLIEIGRSYENRPLYALRLTNKATGQNKPVLFVMSNVHGREMITPEVTLAFIQTLLSGYNTDADITWLLDHHRIEVVVTVNPDGHIKNEPGQPWTWWRKNTNPQGCSYVNYYGVDLNRNYPFRWSAAGVSGPCDSTYPGTAPLSEPETQAIVAYLRTVLKDQGDPGAGQAAPLTTEGLFIDVHSYGNLVLWPWGDTPAAPPNSAELTALGGKLAAITGYRPSQSYQGLYPTSGTADDWVYAELGVPGYTIEVGDGNAGFYPSCSLYDSLVPPNVQMLLYAAKVARQPYQLAYGPDVTALQVLNSTPLGADEPLRIQAVIDDAQTGGRALSAAEAYIDTPPWAGGRACPLQAADGSFNSAREVVTGQLPTTDLASGRHLVFVRGRDTSGAWGPFTAAFFTVAAEGTLNGQVREAQTGLPLADLPVTLRSAAGVRTTRTDAQGRYSFYTRAGSYSLETGAWGYSSALETVQVLSNQTVTRDVLLYPLPRGRVIVQVQEVGSARPLTATVRVSGTLISALATPQLELELPMGSHILSAEAPGYAPRQAAVTVSAQTTSTVSFRLLPPPPLLVVDDDGGTSANAALLATLNAMGYPFVLWEVALQGPSPADVLAGYPAVAWLCADASAPLDEAERAALTAYLETGGHLLLVSSRLGEQLATTPFYRDVLHAAWIGAIPAPWSVTGEAAFAGLTAAGDVAPADVLAPASDVARVVARYADGSGAALQTDTLLYLGFDLNAQSAPMRQAWLERLLPLLSAWPPARLEARLEPSVSAFVPGQPVTYRLTLHNDSLWAINSLALSLTVPNRVVISGVTVQQATDVLRWSSLSVGPDADLTTTWMGFLPPDLEQITWEVEASWAYLPSPLHVSFVTPVRLLTPRTYLPVLLLRAAGTP